MIRLRFVLGIGCVSSAIATFSAGHLSHVDAKLPNGKLLGARSDNIGGGDGVLERADPYEQVKKVRMFEISVTVSQEQAFLKFLANQLGKPYDRLAILAFAFARNWRDDEAWYCSELIAAALEFADIIKKDLFLPVNKVTPVMLATLVSDLPLAQEVAKWS